MTTHQEDLINSSVAISERFEKEYKNSKFLKSNVFDIHVNTEQRIVLQKSLKINYREFYRYSWSIQEYAGSS